MTPAEENNIEEFFSNRTNLLESSEDSDSKLQYFNAREALYGQPMLLTQRSMNLTARIVDAKSKVRSKIQP